MSSKEIHARDKIFEFDGSVTARDALLFLRKEFKIIEGPGSGGFVTKGKLGINVLLCDLNVTLDSIPDSIWFVGGRNSIKKKVTSNVKSNKRVVTTMMGIVSGPIKLTLQAEQRLRCAVPRS